MFQIPRVNIGAEAQVDARGSEVCKCIRDQAGTEIRSANSDVKHGLVGRACDSPDFSLLNPPGKLKGR